MDINRETFVNSQQENQLLLNAIKNKFDGQIPTEASSFSPPKFNIPLLKIPGNKTLVNVNIDQKNMPTIPSNNTSTQLNHFLLKQLQEKHTNKDSTEKLTGFRLPKLQTSCDKKTVKCELPTLNPLPATPTAIDLSTALAIKLQTRQVTPPTRALAKPEQGHAELDFEIPFIDCDHLDISEKHTFHFPASNEYCVTDVSQLIMRHSLAEPSVIGRLLSIDEKKYLDPLPLKYFNPQYQQQKVKHVIEPFNFETKSPDDLVQLALSKTQRRHYN